MVADAISLVSTSRKCCLCISFTDCLFFYRYVVLIFYRRLYFTYKKNPIPGYWFGWKWWGGIFRVGSFWTFSVLFTFLLILPSLRILSCSSFISLLGGIPTISATCNYPGWFCTMLCGRVQFLHAQTIFHDTMQCFFYISNYGVFLKLICWEIWIKCSYICWRTSPIFALINF